MFQDYDVSFHVTELQPFLDQPEWVDVFGERIIMQMPEAMSMFPPELGGRFSYLMLFTDGNRIDLILAPLGENGPFPPEDRLVKVLLDKDGLFPQTAPPTDRDYWVKRPETGFFTDCCNEFWWVSTYVAKGLWRKELLYAQEHLNRFLRPMLLTMLDWQVGLQNGFSVSTGKHGKYLEKHLPRERWEELLSTYAAGSYPAVWEALFAATRLFRRTAREAAAQLGSHYPEEEDRRVSAYLEHVRQLPEDAASIY
jgi:aminoglycoside 6-adenylyltransferase